MKAFYYTYIKFFLLLSVLGRNVYGSESIVTLHNPSNVPPSGRFFNAEVITEQGCLVATYTQSKQTCNEPLCLSVAHQLYEYFCENENADCVMQLQKTGRPSKQTFVKLLVPYTAQEKIATFWASKVKPVQLFTDNNGGNVCAMVVLSEKPVGCTNGHMIVPAYIRITNNGNIKSPLLNMVAYSKDKDEKEIAFEFCEDVVDACAHQMTHNYQMICDYKTTHRSESDKEPYYWFYFAINGCHYQTNLSDSCFELVKKYWVPKEQKKLVVVEKKIVEKKKQSAISMMVSTERVYDINTVNCSLQYEPARELFIMVGEDLYMLVTLTSEDKELVEQAQDSFYLNSMINGGESYYINQVNNNFLSTAKIGKDNNKGSSYDKSGYLVFGVAFVALCIWLYKQ